LEREHCLRSFLGLAFRIAEDRPERRLARGCDKAVRRALQFLEDGYAESLTLDEIAGAVGLSIYHLEHSFAAKLGMPIHRMLQHIRVRRAMVLLRAGARPADTWARCGFADQAHMTRTFRNCVRLTPGQYRAKGVSSRAQLSGDASLFSKPVLRFVLDL
jgi:AraC-like DNA-binding protein